MWPSIFRPRRAHRRRRLRRRHRRRSPRRVRRRRAGRRGRVQWTPIALVAACALALGALAWGRSDGDEPDDGSTVVAREDRSAAGPQSDRSGDTPSKNAEPANAYAHTRVGMVSPVVKDDLERIYVPNSDADTVSVIDPRKAKVVDTFPTGDLPHHITPAHDLKTFYIDNTGGNTLTRIDPETGRQKARPIPVDDPYNLYFTPDGRSAIVVAERMQRLDFRDPHSWKVQVSVPAGCAGVDHMDFTADGRREVVSCEFDGTLLLLHVQRRQVLRRPRLDHPGAKPVDVRLSPDGKLFYVADEVANGVWKLDAAESVSRASSQPAAAPTASTRAATRASCT